MAAVIERWTAERVRQLPDDGKRYEVIDGELFVTPAPRLGHQAIAYEFATLLGEYARTTGTGIALFSPADIEYGPETLVQPDVFVAGLVGGRRPRQWREMEHLILAVEILSPTTARADRQIKRALYQREGVGEYWIVDGDSRVVERWRPRDERPEILAERLEWQPSESHPALVIDLPQLFARALD